MNGNCMCTVWATTTIELNIEMETKINLNKIKWNTVREGKPE